MPAGGSTKLTGETQRKICTGLRAGLSITRACSRAGINRATFYAWCRRGATGEEPYATFFLKQEAALADFQKRHLARIEKHAKADLKDSWRASAWLLERRFPGEFSERSGIHLQELAEELTSDAVIRLLVAIRQRSPDVYAELTAEIRSAGMADSYPDPPEAIDLKPKTTGELRRDNRDRNERHGLRPPTRGRRNP
jgi:transposase